MLKCQLHKYTTYELQLRLGGFCHVTSLTHKTMLGQIFSVTNIDWNWK